MGLVEWGGMELEEDRCSVCGQAGAFVIQPVAFLGDTVTFRQVFCRGCQEKLANATRFLVERRAGGWSVQPVDADNRPLLRRGQ